MGSGRGGVKELVVERVEDGEKVGMGKEEVGEVM